MNKLCELHKDALCAEFRLEHIQLFSFIVSPYILVYSNFSQVLLAFQTDKENV